MGRLQTMKHGPAIMFGAGVVGMVATAVLASRATLKLDEVITETEALQNEAEKYISAAANTEQEGAAKRLSLKIHIRQWYLVGKLYAPAIVCGSVSIALLTGSHVILTQRNTALMAAYAAVDQGFRKYRDRVTDELGQEKDLEFLHGVEEVEVEKTNDKGKVEKTVKRVASGDVSMYARLYNSDNDIWVHNAPEMNLSQLRMIQTSLTQKLKLQGHLFLNEAYDQLGFDRTKAGAVVGWVYNSPDGDGYVDFGIWDDDRVDRLMDFVSGREDQIVVDFNVDGVIYDRI